MAVKGDFRKLQQLGGKFASMGGSGFRAGLSKVLAGTARAQITRSFTETSEDPYGRTWKASWQRRGKNKGEFKGVGTILQDTRRLYKSLVPIDVTESGFRIYTDVAYAAIHQYGGRITLPEHSRTLFQNKKGRFVSRRKLVRAIEAGRLKSIRQTSATFYARSFVMPRRQYMPEGRLGPIWGPAFGKATREYVQKHMKLSSEGAS